MNETKESSSDPSNSHKDSLDDFTAFPLTALDRTILATPPALFLPHTWPEIRFLVAQNRLEDFKRAPSELRRYLRWSESIKARYGSVTDYVVRERLHWTPLPSRDTDTDGAEVETDDREAVSVHRPPRFAYENATLFADERDYRVLRNDWPYALEDGVEHLVVWLKTPVAVNEETGDVTEEARRTIDAFVKVKFRARLDAVYGAGEGEARVVWFKNWVALQSVRGVDHVHVLVRGVPEEVLREWTGE